jgi:hypothetical protein
MARLTKKKYAVVAAIGAVALTAGTAFAFFTDTGSGTGTATTGTSTAWNVKIDSSNDANLTPTTAAGDPVEVVNFHIKNDSTGIQSYSTVTPVVTGTGNSGCAASNYAITNLTVATGPVNAGATVDGTFELRLVDNGGNQDNCKSAVVNLKVSVS